MPRSPTSWRQRRGWRAFAALLAVGTLSLSVYYIASKLRQSIRQVGQFELALSPGPLVLSFAIIFACVLSGGLIWYLVLRGVGARPRLVHCTRIHLLSNLGGYLPGYGWRFVGKAYLTQKLGIPLRVVSTGVLLEFSVLAATRIVVALTVLPRAWLSYRGLEALLPYLIPARILAWALLAAFPLLMERGLRWLQSRNADRWGEVGLDRAFIWLALGTMSLTWTVYGLGSGAVFQALHGLRGSDLGLVIFSTTASSLVSLILFVVPGGLAVRESVVIFALEGFLPDLVVTAGALIGRAVLLGCELFGALLVWLMGVAAKFMSITQRD